MAIHELTQVVTPPSVPINAGPNTNRPLIEAELGLAIPNDVFDFALAYGSGSFSRHQFSVHNPFAPGYVQSIRNYCDLFRGIKADLGDAHIPHDIFPDSPGLFPWGSEDNGHEMYWLMDGDPNDWPIIIYLNRAADFERWERWEMSITEFLTKAFHGELQHGLFSKLELLTEFETRQEFQSWIV